MPTLALLRTAVFSAGWEIDKSWHKHCLLNLRARLIYWGWISSAVAEIADRTGELSNRFPLQV